jgi:hypothetical protein
MQYNTLRKNQFPGAIAQIYDGNNVRWEENKLACMKTKKNLILMFYFVHKNRISTTAIQLGSLELVYDIYWY